MDTTLDAGWNYKWITGEEYQAIKVTLQAV